jgi:hypothetical protein
LQQTWVFGNHGPDGACQRRNHMPIYEGFPQ